MADHVFEGILVGAFALGVLGIVWLAIAGVVSRHRDHRTAQERWADDHGDEDPDKLKLHGGPSWTGAGPGF